MTTNHQAEASRSPLSFDIVNGGSIVLEDYELVVAGYTGRDSAAVNEHIRELAAIGVAPPESVPTFFPLEPGLLSQDESISVSGANTSGEVEPVLVRASGRLFLGVGSDHTDRDIERDSVLDSKAACPKPLGSSLIEVTEGFDWDSVRLTSTQDGQVYQEGSLRSLLIPVDVLKDFEASAGDRGDIIMFGGTVPILGGEFIPAHAWSMTLSLPDGISLTHSYRVDVESAAKKG